ncbi:Phytanoyl-CoA dioxygenase (PhyH) [Seminavis robusta]|uniref:Phytanoyl-CoA dioxygenase (PhyH) n=1 Tax=Seminavis robusta TaxID=568900 RepID=A0A9N8ECX1_9STRA|nr:Phytanoyl-CoA dioxygenase (PhyH) [Seminavis robusta]|eukprot:Sro939_g222460.1 Phytanoyl-CoA dioxygenase (PhyH) (352) ;mRNA; r:26401-27456
MTTISPILLFLCYLFSSLSVGFGVTNADSAVAKVLCDASPTCNSATPPSTSSTTTISDKNDKKLNATRDKFNRDGYIVLKNYFRNNDDPTQEESLVPLLGDDWHDFSLKYWNRIFQVLHEKGHISEPHHVMNDEYNNGKLRHPGYKEIVHRYPGRYELSLNRISDHTKEEDSLLYHDMPLLQPIIDKLEHLILSILKQHPNYQELPDGTKYNLLHSMLISAPHSLIQKFHVDTKHTNEEEHWPAHIINVFIPLVNMTTRVLGPTEVVPRSHVQTRFMYSDNPQTRSQAKPLGSSTVTPLMNVGDVLMFDFRTLHRGLPNVSRNQNRPMLVLAFSIPSFHDKANWPGPSIFE